MGPKLFTVRSAAAALLSTAALASAQNAEWDHSLYTTSPPIYPSPNATGHSWEAAFAQASAFVDQLTLEEKAQLVTGTAGPCTGNIAPIERLGFSGLCLQDGPLAIRQATYASVFPAGLTVAASWDRELTKKRGVDMGMEFKGKGANVVLGPVAGPLGRTAYGGRNWEGFSPDNYLTGVLFEDTIVAMQSTGVQACAKHYIGNEQEIQRNPSPSFESSGPSGSPRIEAVSSNIDDRTMHEAYLWPFANAVHAGVASIMCSYQRLNGSYGCQNSKALNGILKDELEFQGWVVSDWGAVHTGYASIEAGLDVNMPGGIAFIETEHSYFGANLTMAVNNGSLPIQRVDDQCRRVMTPYFYLNQQNDIPAIDPTVGPLNFFPTPYLSNYTYGTPNVDVRENHAELIRELGAAGIVLLKNENNALPLKDLQNIGVFGNDAGDVVNGQYFQNNAAVNQLKGYPEGVLPAGGGSGTGRLTYLVSPLEALKAYVAKQSPRALVQYITNNTLVSDDNGWSILAPKPEVCLVFLNTWASEGDDRLSLDVDWDGNAVVETVAANCSNTIVVTHSGGLNVLPWADHPNVTAILAAHYGGQETGNSIIDVLFGKQNPSGHLPYTIAHNTSDYDFAPITNSTELLETTDPNAWQSDFTEGLLIDYKHFDYYNISVQYEFGHGLSYTTFDVSNLDVSPLSSTTTRRHSAPHYGNSSSVSPPGGDPTLWKTSHTITATLTNKGSVPGAAVPQLYLSIPTDSNAEKVTKSPVRQLRGFEKVFLEAGQSKDVEFELMKRDVSFWDVVGQEWRVVEGGEVKVWVGLSSRDLRVEGKFTL